MLKKTARVILTYDCPRDCVGCCNKDWKHAPARQLSSFAIEEADQIILTGGEPLLYPEKVLTVMRWMKAYNSKVEIIVYTALFKENYADLITIMYMADGMTITLHKQEDYEDFKRFNDYLMNSHMPKKSLRLNVFKPVDVSSLLLPLWKVKKDIVWLKDCPLPNNETLYKL